MASLTAATSSHEQANDAAAIVASSAAAQERVQSLLQRSDGLEDGFVSVRASPEESGGAYMSRNDAGWERSEVVESLRQQLQQERAWTKALMAQMEQRLRAELMSQHHGGPTSAIVATIASAAAVSSASSALPSAVSAAHHTHICAECAEIGRSRRNHRRFRWYCCSGCIILIPLLVGAVGWLLYSNRARIAWLQNTQRWWQQSKQKWNDRPHPILATKAKASEVTQAALTKYTDVKGRTMVYLPSMPIGAGIIKPLRHTPAAAVTVAMPATQDAAAASATPPAA